MVEEAGDAQQHGGPLGVNAVHVDGRVGRLSTALLLRVGLRFRVRVRVGVRVPLGSQRSPSYQAVATPDARQPRPCWRSAPTSERRRRQAGQRRQAGRRWRRQTLERRWGLESGRNRRSHPPHHLPRSQSALRETSSSGQARRLAQPRTQPQARTRAWALAWAWARVRVRARARVRVQASSSSQPGLLAPQQWRAGERAGRRGHRGRE